MILILSPSHDPSGHWLGETLAERGYETALVDERFLFDGSLVRQSIGSDNGWRLALADGRCFSSSRVSHVINRIAYPPPNGGRIAEEDQGYVEAELYAFLVGLLAAMPIVGNPASGQGLVGPWLSADVWQARAVRAGFRSVATRAEQIVQVTCIGRQLLGPPLAPSTRRLILRFAAQAGLRLAGITLAMEPGQPRLVSVDLLPDLTGLGRAGADALASLLAG